MRKSICGTNGILSRERKSLSFPLMQTDIWSCQKRIKGRALSDWRNPAPDGYVRQGYEEEQTKAIEIVINSTRLIRSIRIQALILWKSYSIMRCRQVILLCKSRRTAKTVKDENLLEKAKILCNIERYGYGESFSWIWTGKEVYLWESGVEGAVFELHAERNHHTPDGAVDKNETHHPLWKRCTVATLTTDEDGKRK